MGNPLLQEDFKSSFYTTDKLLELYKETGAITDDQKVELVESLVFAGHEVEGVNADIDFFEAIAGFPSSVKEVAKNIVMALARPNQSFNALSSIARSSIVKLARKISGGAEVVDSEEEAFDQVASFYKERLGTGRRILETIERDPAGFASDIAGLIGGPVTIAGKTVSAGGKLSKITKITRVGQILTKTGQGIRAIEPIRVATKTVQTIARKSNIGSGIANILGKSANRFTKSSIGLSKTDITNFSGELGKKFGNPVEVLNRLGIHGSLEDIVGELGKRKVASMARLDRVLNASTKTFETPLLKRAFRNINSTLGAFDSPEKRLLRKTTGRLLEKMKSKKEIVPKTVINDTKVAILDKEGRIVTGRPNQHHSQIHDRLYLEERTNVVPGIDDATDITGWEYKGVFVSVRDIDRTVGDFQKAFQIKFDKLRVRAKPEGVTLKEINEVKRIAQDVLAEKVFKKGGDLKASKIADTLGSDMNRLKVFVERKALDEGLRDVQKINKQTQFFRGMEDFVQKEITGIPSPSRNILQAMIIAAGATGAVTGKVEIAIGATFALAGLKVFTSTKFRTALATKLRSLSDKQRKLLQSAHSAKKRVLTRPEIRAVKELYGGLSKVFPELRLVEVTQNKDRR